jgi:hypothetical protein
MSKRGATNGQMQHAFLEGVQTQKEFHLFTSRHRLHHLFHAVAAWTFERIAAPDLKDEIAPKGAHESGTAPHGAAGRLG